MLVDLRAFQTGAVTPPPDKPHDNARALSYAPRHEPWTRTNAGFWAAGLAGFTVILPGQQRVCGKRRIPTQWRIDSAALRPLAAALFFHRSRSTVSAAPAALETCLAAAEADW